MADVRRRPCCSAHDVIWTLVNACMALGAPTHPRWSSSCFPIYEGQAEEEGTREETPQTNWGWICFPPTRSYIKSLHWAFQTSSDYHLITSNTDSKVKSDSAINGPQHFWLAYLNYPASSEANLKDLESGLKAVHQSCFVIFFKSERSVPVHLV